jgi:hypothetical protein
MSPNDYQIIQGCIGAIIILIGVDKGSCVALFVGASIALSAF